LPQERPVRRRDGRAPRHARAWTAAEIALLTTVVAAAGSRWQRVHALNALRERRGALRLIVEQAMTGLLADDDGRFSPRTRRPARCWAGRTRALTLGVRDLVRPGEQPRLAALWGVL
jgi:GAF domain-containing protein